MHEERVSLLARRLESVLRTDLAPDAAGSTALAWALLAAQTEAEQGGTPDGTRDVLLEEIASLPAFVEGERERGSTDGVVALVRRFARGERPPAAPASADAGSPAARRRARLRALQREGVDLSLIETALAQTPHQRIINMERQLQFVRQLRQARRNHEAGR